MPSISMFYGIIITMNWDDHNPPHFHARYAGSNASYTFDGKLLAGHMPEKQEKLIVAWAALHSEELAANWEICRDYEHPYKISPLQ